MIQKFATTRWSIVLAAGEDPGELASTALESLCDSYWSPLYAFVRRQGYSAEDACDLTQSYFARLLEKRYLQDVHPRKGRFRSFLLVSLRHFLSDERDRDRAVKRGGDKVHFSLDAEAAEEIYRHQPVERWTPETLFERRWAETVIERSMESLRQQLTDAGKSWQYEVLGPCLTSGRLDLPYQEIAEQRGMTEGAVKVAVHRLRQRFGRLLREEVAETVASPDQVDDELRHLLEVLRKAS